MANKFPLVFNTTTSKIEELVSGDNLDITNGGLLTTTISASGQITSTQANSTTTGGGQIHLNGATGNRIDFNINGVAAPTLSTRSAGTKLVLYPLVGPSTVDYAFGIENNTLWSSVSSTSDQFKWYAGTTNIATLSGTGSLTVTGTTNLKQITETVANNFNTVLAPSTGTLTIDTSLATVFLGDINASVTTWAFTNVSTTNSKATTITLIIDGDIAQTYGDACSVNGSAVSGGIKWSGGVAPDASNNFDILTFTIVRDSAGTVNVFGSSSVNFS
jgi:hypothetical protein